MAVARVRCAIGQMRILWLGWAGLGWAGLGGRGEQLFAWAMHQRESCDCNTRSEPEYGWVRYLSPFYKIEI